MKVLVAGWFSFEGMGATAGDLLSRDIICQWFTETGTSYDVATAPPFVGGVDWQKTQSADYTHILFVCGPFGNGFPVTEFLSHFDGTPLIGINLSMLQPLSEWNPFDLLLERDSSEVTRPDLSFLSTQPPVPVVGLALVHPQKEYGDRGQHERMHGMIQEMLIDVPAAIIPIDTRLDSNATGLRSPAEIESLIARMDAVITTRLHGTVLAIKNGVPVVAIDPISGGAKISLQAQSIGWPIVLTADGITPDQLRSAYEFCLTPEAKRLATECAERGRTILSGIRDELFGYLSSQ